MLGFDSLSSAPISALADIAAAAQGGVRARDLSWAYYRPVPRQLFVESTVELRAVAWAEVSVSRASASEARVLAVESGAMVSRGVASLDLVAAQVALASHVAVRSAVRSEATGAMRVAANVCSSAAHRSTASVSIASPARVRRASRVAETAGLALGAGSSVSSSTKIERVAEMDRRDLDLIVLLAA